MKVIIYMAFSANGMISNNSNNPNWLSKEFGEGFMAICKKAKAVIMGRKSYDILAPDYLPLHKEGMIAVVTHDTGAIPANPSVIFTDKEPNGILEMFEEKGFDEIVLIGGMTTASAFLKANLVDELFLVIEPVLFGGGLPLVKDVAFEYQLSLQDVKKLNDNTVQLHYQMKR